MATSKRDGKKKTKESVKKTPVSTVKTPVISTKEVQKAPTGFLKGVVGFIWGRPVVTAEIRVGRTVVNREKRWFFGPGEGRWWRNFAWWVIPLGVCLFIWPGWVTLWLSEVTTNSPIHFTSLPAPPSLSVASSSSSTKRTRPTPKKMTSEEHRRYKIWVERK